MQIYLNHENCKKKMAFYPKKKKKEKKVKTPILVSLKFLV